MVSPLREDDGVFRPHLTRVSPVCYAVSDVTHWSGINIQTAAEFAVRDLNQSLERRVAQAVAGGAGGAHSVARTLGRRDRP